MAIINGTEGNDNGAPPGGPGNPGPALVGTNGDDVIHGLGGDDFLDGGAGNDLLYGDDGNDSLDGGQGDDLLDGGAGDDGLTDSYGVNQFVGGAGNDSILSTSLSSGQQIDAGSGDDTIQMLFGQGTINGGAGSDRILVGYPSGDNVITGGDGSDTFTFTYGTWDNAITDFQVGAGGDVLPLINWLGSNVNYPGGNPIATGHVRLLQVGADTLMQLDADGPGSSGVFRTVVTLRNVAANTLSAFNFGGYNPDGSIAVGQTISGTSGNDNGMPPGGPVASGPALEGGTGPDTVHGLAGDDRIVGNDGNDTLYGDDGNDNLEGGYGDDTLYGGAGIDYLTDFYGSNFFDGGDGDDGFLIGNFLQTEIQTVEGGAGNDSVDLVVGKANISGGAGADTITIEFRSAGGNILSGGADSDTFIFQYGTIDNVISDFAAGAGGDVIRVSLAGTLNYSGGDPFADGHLRLVQSGSDTLLQVDSDGASSPAQFVTMVKLLNVAAGSLTAANFNGYTPVVQIVVPPRPVENDFNGDGRSDILWRTSTGTIFNFLGTANGGVINNGGNSSVAVDPAYSVAGLGDFNGDGRTDILWRNPTSGVVFNFLGTASGGYSSNGDNSFVAAGTNVRVVGIGDFNGDGRADILWRNDAGTIFNFLGTASGGFTSNGANSAVNVDNAYQVAGTGDFNGDGRTDILWRNSSTGVIFNFLGTASGGFSNNGDNSYVAVGTSTQVAGIGDFDGDGRSDILWRNGAGTIFNFLGTASGGYANNGGNSSVTVDNAWHIASTADFNGDNRADILWRNDAGVIFDFLGTASGGFSNNGDNSYVALGATTLVQDPFL